MPGGTKAASLEEDSQSAAKQPDEDAAAFLKHNDRYRTVRHLVDELAEDQWDSIRELIHLLSYIKISPEDTKTLEAALLHAQGNRRMSDAQQNKSLMPYLVESLSQRSNAAPSADADTVSDSPIPDLTEAPREEFRGVNTDGDAYEYLLRVYGPWLQEGKKCLDRPSASRLDGKLLKALQQKYTRNKRSMPPLSEVFPTVTEARAIREKFRIAGL